MEDLRVLFFLYMVQAFLVITVGLKFYNLKLETKKLLLGALTFGLIIWIVRKAYIYFEIPYGTHTLVLITLYALFLKLFFKLTFNYAIGMSLFGFTLILLGGNLVGYIFEAFKISVEHVLSSPLLHTVFGNIENSFLLLALIIMRIFNFNLGTIYEKIERR